MKLAVAYEAGLPRIRHQVWVKDDAELFDVVNAHGIGKVQICGFVVGGKPQEPEPEFDVVEAVEIEVGDYIWYDNSKWAKVTNAYKHPLSTRVKLNVIPEDAAESYAKYRNSGIYYPLYKGDKVRRRKEKVNMSIALISASDLVKSLQTKLIDFAALADAPERVEIMPTVYVNKMPVMVALKQDIKADYAKLGEVLKKL